MNHTTPPVAVTAGAARPTAPEESPHSSCRESYDGHLQPALLPRARADAAGLYEPPDGLEGADRPDERSRADVGALGQGAAQQVKSALFNKELQVPDAAYEHAERLDGRPT